MQREKVFSKRNLPLPPSHWWCSCHFWAVPGLWKAKVAWPLICSQLAAPEGTLVSEPLSFNRNGGCHPAMFSPAMYLHGKTENVLLQKWLLARRDQGIIVINKSEDPAWVDQWPLTEKKIKASQKLLQEQLDSGHIVPSNFLWNSTFS